MYKEVLREICQSSSRNPLRWMLVVDCCRHHKLCWKSNRRKEVLSKISTSFFLILSQLTLCLRWTCRRPLWKFSWITSSYVAYTPSVGLWSFIGGVFWNHNYQEVLRVSWLGYYPPVSTYLCNRVCKSSYWFSAHLSPLKSTVTVWPYYSICIISHLQWRNTNYTWVKSSCY